MLFLPCYWLWFTARGKPLGFLRAGAPTHCYLEGVSNDLAFIGERQGQDFGRARVHGNAVQDESRREKRRPIASRAGDDSRQVLTSDGPKHTTAHGNDVLQGLCFERRVLL